MEQTLTITEEASPFSSFSSVSIDLSLPSPSVQEEMWADALDALADDEHVHERTISVPTPSRMVATISKGNIEVRL